MAEPFDPHELGHLDGPGDADLREVVAREVDEHEVLGLLLGVGDELGLEIGVVLGVAPRGLEPAIGCVKTRPSLHLHQCLGRGAHDPVGLARGSSRCSRYMYGLGLRLRSTR